MSWESLKKVQRIFLSVIIWLILITNRQEKFLRHVVMMATFLDDNKPKFLFKSKFALFQVHRTYSISFDLSNVGEIFWI